MAVRGQGALGVWMDVLPEAEEDYNRWYREQHLPERLAVSGFLRGRRYVTIAGAPKYFTLYETEDAQVLSSPSYLARLNNPTDWTRRVLPTMRNMVRNAYRLLRSVGGGDGEAVVTFRLEPVSGQEGELRSRFPGDVLARMVELPAVVSASLFEAEQVATGVITEERRLVGTMSVAPQFLCICEMRDPSGTDQSAWKTSAWKTLEGTGGAGLKGDLVGGVTENAFCLMYSLARSR